MKKRGRGGDSPDMRELSQQIDSLMVVIDEENPTTATPTEMQGAPQSTLGSVPLVAREVPTTTGLVEPFCTYYFLFLLGLVKLLCI